MTRYKYQFSRTFPLGRAPSYFWNELQMPIVQTYRNPESPKFHISLSLLFLCFVDRASLYNLVNKANMVHNLFLVYLPISTCFGRLCDHHQEKQLCSCDTWYLLFCVDDCNAGWNKFIPPCITDSHPHRITSTKCRMDTVVSPDDGHIVARNM